MSTFKNAILAAMKRRDQRKVGFGGLMERMLSLGVTCDSAVKNPPSMQETKETWVQSLGQEDPLEEGMATHSSILS